MRKNKTYHRKKTVLLWVLCMGMMVGLAGRLVYLCVFRSVYYSEKADDLHERERGIKAARGRILDANGEVLAANRTVCTISVIHSQIEEPEAVIAMLVKELGISGGDGAETRGEAVFNRACQDECGQEDGVIPSARTICGGKSG